MDTILPKKVSESTFSASHNGKGGCRKAVFRRNEVRQKLLGSPLRHIENDKTLRAFVQQGFETIPTVGNQESRQWWQRGLTLFQIMPRIHQAKLPHASRYLKDHRGRL